MADGGFEKKPLRIAAHCPVAVIESVAEAVRYRKAWSELQIINALGLERPKCDVSYHFITGGEIDQITWISAAMRYVGRLDRLVLTTWKISSDGCRDIKNLVMDDKVSSLALFVGDRVDSAQREIFRAVAEFTDRFRFYAFPVHAKIIAGISEAEDFAFVVESSANCSINKRIEQACFTVSRHAYTFFNDYFSELGRRIDSGDITPPRDLRSRKNQMAFDL